MATARRLPQASTSVRHSERADFVAYCPPFRGPNAAEEPVEGSKPAPPGSDERLRAQSKHLADNSSRREVSPTGPPPTSELLVE